MLRLYAVELPPLLCLPFQTGLLRAESVVISLPRANATGAQFVLFARTRAPLCITTQALLAVNTRSELNAFAVLLSLAL